MTPNDFMDIRQTLAGIDSAPAHHADRPPNIGDIFSPRGHATALDPERILVVGGRGVGKSFWSGVLCNDATRQHVSQSYPRLKLDLCQVTLGFSGTDTSDLGPPSREILDDLEEKDQFNSEIIWRAVVLHGLRPWIDLELPKVWRGSAGLVSWAHADAERLQNTLRAADKRLVERGLRQVIVFDALDRLGGDWPQIQRRSKALLRVALPFMAYQAVKLKIFMRIDQAEDQSLFSFPDASKLVGQKVNLTWEKKDLYGLLFSVLENRTKNSGSFRNLIEACLGRVPNQETSMNLPASLINDEEHQARVFSKMAGSFMGSNAQRGKTYTWVYNHLSDTFGSVSPCSFLESLRAAAITETHLDDKVIDPKGLKKGLQSASILRLNQLREEYGWIQTALEPLADLRVPCEEIILFACWKKEKSLARIQKAAKIEGFLPPVEFDTGGGSDSSLLKALLRIGVAEIRPDGRVNIPDIYRVAAKILKKGGVPPPA
ncbi:MAG: hypothetical protein H7833_11280 [Magnetococcus sp. DMHC-1]